MLAKNYLKEYQDVAYKVLENALNSNTLSHAYLLVGDNGVPLMQIAKFLAKSILCDEPDPFACENCITCMRIDHDNYPDLKILDGSKQTITKDGDSKKEIEGVSDIIERFGKKALETKGICVYILHLVENMTVQAVNAILKFLEEPGQNTYAILTTNNVNAILPTIISRCQTLSLKLVPREIVISKAISEEVPELDAQLLSYFLNDADLIKQDYENDEDYKSARDSLLNLLDVMLLDKNEALYEVERKILPGIDNKESARYFLDMLTCIFEELVAIEYGKPIILDSISDKLTNLNNSLKHIDESLKEILKIRKDIALNLNIALTIEHLILFIFK